MQEDCRVVIGICRKKTQKAKAQLELKPANVLSDEKYFFKYIYSKRRSKENSGLTLVEDGHLANKVEDKMEAFFFLPQSLIILTNLGLPGPLGQ